jgi:hypothetical protein
VASFHALFWEGAIPFLAATTQRSRHFLLPIPATVLNHTNFAPPATQIDKTATVGALSTVAFRLEF